MRLKEEFKKGGREGRCRVRQSMVGERRGNMMGGRVVSMRLVRCKATVHWVYVRRGVVLEAPDRVGTTGLSPSTRAMDEWRLSQRQ